VGVGAVGSGPALAALATAVVRALQGGRERPRRDGATRAGRTRQQPGVRHRARLHHRPRQGLDRRLLTDDVTPDAHSEPPFATAASRPEATSRPMTASWISSGATVPSTTR